jgi:6-phosphogluconolactonase
MAMFVAAASRAQAAADAQSTVRVYIGTVTGRGPSKGIYRVDLDRAAGKLGEVTLAGEAVNPGFIALHPNGQFLYSVGQQPSPDKTNPGTVTAYSIDSASGDLRTLNQQASGGVGPAYVMVDRAGRNVLVANYSGSSAAVLPLAADGTLEAASCVVRHEGSSVNPKRQESPHPHSIYLDAANRFAFVPDLGLDKVMIYRFDGNEGNLAANEPAFVKLPPGSGPRHFAFHPDGQHAYAINELASTVTAMDYDPQSGALVPRQTISTLPPGANAEQLGNTTADIHVHPSGRFVYGSNRGHNSIAIFAIDEESKTLAPLGYQGEGIKTPRNFGIDPSGNFLLVANLDGDNLSLFRIDRSTGQLAPTGSTAEVSKPMCVKFLAAAP